MLGRAQTDGAREAAAGRERALVASAPAPALDFAAAFANLPPPTRRVDEPNLNRRPHASDERCSMLAASLATSARAESALLAKQQSADQLTASSAASSESVLSLLEAAESSTRLASKAPMASERRAAAQAAEAAHQPLSDNKPIVKQPLANGAVQPPPVGPFARFSLARRRVPSWPAGRSADSDSPPRSPALARPSSSKALTDVFADRTAAAAKSAALQQGSVAGAGAGGEEGEDGVGELSAASALRSAVQSVLDAGEGDFAIFWAPSVTDALLSFRARARPRPRAHNSAARAVCWCCAALRCAACPGAAPRPRTEPPFPPASLRLFLLARARAPAPNPTTPIRVCSPFVLAPDAAPCNRNDDLCSPPFCDLPTPPFAFK